MIGIFQTRKKPFFTCLSSIVRPPEDQERSVALFEALGDDRLTDYAIRHRDIIARFGRFPHRNDVLGRKSTDAEEEFLKQPGSSF